MPSTNQSVSSLMPEAKKIKPLTVLVHWSESREFTEETLYDFCLLYTSDAADD